MTRDEFLHRPFHTTILENLICLPANLAKERRTLLITLQRWVANSSGCVWVRSALAQCFLVARGVFLLLTAQTASWQTLWRLQLLQARVECGWKTR